MAQQPNNSLAPTPYQPPQQQALTTTNETAGQVLAAQAEAEVKAAYWVALQRPRDLDDVRQKMLKECRRPGFAKVAVYHKPIGAGIEGPSIRFAEAALRAMGNVVVQTPTIYDDEHKRIMRVSVFDIESNTAYRQDITIMKRVERQRLANNQVPISSRTNSYGKVTYLVPATDDEILNTQNALVSKAIRTLGLRLVPGWIIDECLTTAKQVMAEADTQDPDAARKALFDAFDEVGVGVGQIKAYLGHDGGKLTPKELSELRGLFAAVRDGETTWREAMDGREGKPDAQAGQAQTQAQPQEPSKAKGAAAVKEQIKRKQATETTAAPSEPAREVERDDQGRDLNGDPETDPKP